jgi:hypothetical protein
VPWAALALDYAENVACGILVATFPNESSSLASLPGVLTAAKFAAYAACVVAVAVARIGQRKPRPPISAEQM